MSRVTDLLRTVLGGGGARRDGPSESLHFRRHREAIVRAGPVAHYDRIVPHLRAGRILEIGAAEGVLALKLAAGRERVYAVELNPDRHAAAVALKDTWTGLGEDVGACEMIRADVLDRLELLDRVDEVVSVRCIYHFRERIDALFAALAARVPRVVLVGNAGRARRYDHPGAGRVEPALGDYERYASRRGMCELLEAHGYRIADVVPDGDPIVVGER